MTDREGSLSADRTPAEEHSDSHILENRAVPLSNGFQSPQVGYQQRNINFDHDIPPHLLLGNVYNLEAQNMPGTHTNESIVIGATDIDLSMQETFLSIDWVDAFDASTTTYSSVFHTAQPLWPVANASPDSLLTDNAPRDPISENFEGTLPKPGTDHRGKPSERNRTVSRSFFDRMFSHRSSLEPRVSPHSGPRLNCKTVQITATVRANIASKLELFSPQLVEGFTLPSQHELNRYICAYFDGFHEHLPFIHTPTWTAESCDTGLFIAMCALGARYCFEHETSMILWKAGKAVVRSKLEERGDLLPHENACGIGDTNDTTPETSVEVIEMCQAMFLLMAFGTWTGNRYLLRQALSFQSALAAVSQPILYLEPLSSQRHLTSR